MIRIHPNLPKGRDELRQAWCYSTLDQLRHWSTVIGSRLLSDVSIRQDLIGYVHGKAGVVDGSDRVILAMGNLSNGSQDTQKSWWAFVKYSVDLTRWAVESRLHTRYMLPQDTFNLFSYWMDVGEEMHDAAVIAWDRAVSPHARPHLLKALLDAPILGATHMEKWEDRIKECWGHACEQIKAEVISSLVIGGSPLPGQNERPFAYRQGWILKWAPVLLDDAPSTRRAVELGLANARAEMPRIEGQCMGIFQSYLDATSLEDAVTMPALENPRMRL